MASTAVDPETDLDKNALMSQLNGGPEIDKGVIDKPATAPVSGAVDALSSGVSNKMPIGGGGGGQTFLSRDTMPAIDQATPAATAPTTAPAFGADTKPSIFQGFTPKYAMEGFDFNREQNTGKSAKDAFAALSQNAPPPPLNDKAALQAWTEQYIVPGMKALGHDVSNVQGDKFHLKNWQGDFDVDYGRGAGAEGGALAWQVDDPTAKLSNAAYNPQAGQTSAAMNPALLSAIGQGGQGADQNDAVKKQIEALIAGGGTPPMDQDALLQQLQV